MRKADLIVAGGMGMAFTNCPKCNARVEFEVGTKFTKCSYCSSQIYIDRSGAGFYYIIPFSVQEKDAIGLFRRWAAGPTKAKDLDKRAQLAGMKRQYFPVYQFKRDVEGKEEIRIEPAGSTTLPGLHSLKVPPGDLKIFDGSFSTEGVELIKPDIEMSSYLSQLPGKSKEQALVYFPIWKVDYILDQKRYEIVVDGSSGEVFAATYPSRGSAPYVAVAGVGYVAFLAETLATAVNPLLAGILMVVTLAGIFGASLFVAWRL
ncbi:MAG: zinc ribbon domain-containing protein [Methanomassiliicoccales archaeon]|nr:zinc ribbon domain-containing protein [Methanomassiliicoccales archaeon]